MANVHSFIKQDILAREGVIIFPEDYFEIGSQEAVLMALSRLVKQKELVRLAHGIYIRPKVHPKLGKILPSLETIAEAIAEKEHVRIRPTGAYALNKLGLSTQVPMRVVFLTDGHPRSIKIGRGRLTFKMTSPKKLAAKNDRVFLAIQALEELKMELEEGDPYFIQLMKELKDVPPSEIRSDAKNASYRVTNTLQKIANKLEHDSIPTA